MDTRAKRARVAFDRLGLSQREISRICGYPLSHHNRLVTGKREIFDVLAYGWECSMGINHRWVLHGEHPILLKDTS